MGVVGPRSIFMLSVHRSRIPAAYDFIRAVLDMTTYIGPGQTISAASLQVSPGSGVFFDDSEILGNTGPARRERENGR